MRVSIVCKGSHIMGSLLGSPCFWETTIFSLLPADATGGLQRFDSSTAPTILNPAQDFEPGSGIGDLVLPLVFSNRFPSSWIAAEEHSLSYHHMGVYIYIQYIVHNWVSV